MNIPDPALLSAVGFSITGAERAVGCYRRVAEVFAAKIGSVAETNAWWVPGRIEVFGKHTDYGGGRSITCPVERGFHLLAAPREDNLIRLVDATTRSEWRGLLSSELKAVPGAWYDYPITAVRRLARDFPSANRGMDAVFLSTLPRASGLSSSSALLISLALPLIKFNRLEELPAWEALSPLTNLAGYVGAMESGQAFGPFSADFGVGTHGGSEDHTAILCGTSGYLSCYRYLPTIQEDKVCLPDSLSFVIASSGIKAAKSGAVRSRYNALAAELKELLALWHYSQEPTVTSLQAALSSCPEAGERLRLLTAGSPNGKRLAARLEQFQAESELIVPAVMQALKNGTLSALGPLSEQSQALAENILCNQLPETSWLVESARDLGAVAASAFGAGFGGSVWALIDSMSVAEFTNNWQSQYQNRFPQQKARSEFFSSRPGPAAFQISP